uniref:Uncharacterized protein n=1 Tax=Romanomermis culicivorax TaxID=13658 RepID=A0A915K9Z6_ROMCU
MRINYKRLTRYSIVQRKNDLIVGLFGSQTLGRRLVALATGAVATGAYAKQAITQDTRTGLVDNHGQYLLYRLNYWSIGRHLNGMEAFFRWKYHAVQVPSNRPIVQTIKQILTMIINETSSGVLRNSLFCICARGHSAGGQSYESTAERLTTEQADNKIIFTLDDRIPVDAKEYDFMVKWGESIRNISEIAGKVIAAAGPKTIYSEYANFVEIFYNEKDYTFYLMPSDKIDRFSSRVTTSAPCLGRPPPSYVYVGPEPNSSRSESRTANGNHSTNGVNDEKLSEKTRSETTSPVGGDATSATAMLQKKNSCRQQRDDQVQRNDSTSFDVKTPKLRNAHSTGSLYCPACSGGSRRSSNKTPDGGDDDDNSSRGALERRLFDVEFKHIAIILQIKKIYTHNFLRPTCTSNGRLGRASVSIPVQLGVFDPGHCDFLTVKRPSDASTTTGTDDEQPPPLPFKPAVDTVKLIVVDPPPPPAVSANDQPIKINNRNNDQSSLSSSSIDVTLKSGDLQKFIENRRSLYKRYHPGEVEYV